MNTPRTPASLDATYRRIGWRLIPLLMLGYVSAYIDRSNIGFAKLQFLADLRLTETMYGIGAGLFYLGYCLFEVPSNLMLAKIGARATFLRIMVLWSLCSASLAFIHDATHFYVLRFLLGAAEAGFFPGVLFYLSQWAPASRRARFTALFMSAMALSGIVGGPLAGLIMHSMDGAAGLKGWQWLFLIEGAPGCLLGLLSYWLLADKPADARWLSDEQKLWVAEDLAREASGRGVQRQHNLVDALKDRRLYVLAMMSVALISGIGGISLWLPTVVRSSGVTDILQIGLLSAVPYIIAVVVQQLVARSSDRHQERRWHAAIPAAVAAIGWFLLPVVQDMTWLALAVLTLMTAGSFGATGPFWSLPASYLSGTAAAGGIAIVTTFGGISGFISPIVVGWATTATGSLAAGQIYYGSLMALGAAVLLYGTRTAQPVGVTIYR
jgi:MFS family permease